jgi:opacity protein-like surface antigen
MTKPMTNFAAACAVSIALISIGASAPALAADMAGNGHGSMKDRGRGGTPVPAPMPVEEHYKYYIGGGLGYTVRASGDMDLTAGGVAGGLPIGGHGDLNGPFVFSAFAGRYITPSLRTEIGLDLRSGQNRSRSMSYNARLSGTGDFGTPTTPDVRTVTNNYAVDRTEDVRLRNNTLMLNVYYDMNRGGRFNPYFGAGVGISHLQFSRNTTEYANCVDGGTHPITGVPVGCWGGTTPGLPTGAVGISSSNAETGFGFAAALMAGLTYNLSERTHLDFGYRLMYQGAKAAVSSASLGPCVNGCGATGISIMNVGSRIDHEIRTGLRWDLW